MMTLLWKHQFFFVLALLMFFNAVDAISTHYVLVHGYAVEANPLMAWLFKMSPVYFHAFKALLMSGVVLLAWRNRQHRSVRIMATVVTGGYELLFWYEVWFLLFMVPT